MRSLLFFFLLSPSADACGIAPVAANASCCECAGFSGSGFPCHWCPPLGCHYHGSPQYNCAGAVAERSKCPAACATVSPTASLTRTPSATPSSEGSPSPSPSPIPIVPLRPFTKKGVGYYGGNCSDFLSPGLSNISWFYDWGHDQESLSRSGCPTSQQANHNVHGVEWVPQIWGKYALKNISDMNVTFIRGARFIFSFNEPDHSGSSYLPPLEASERWPNMVHLARAYNLTLVAPCVSNYASGQWWLQQWHLGCRNLTGANCSFDHTCIHTYFEPSEVGALFSSLERLHADYPAPIWLNEFACPPYKNCSAADNLAFAKLVVPKLEELPYIFRFAWFEARAQGKNGKLPGEALLVTAGNSTPVELTPLGQWYNSFH